jgi:hypothetical protein
MATEIALHSDFWLQTQQRNSKLHNIFACFEPNSFHSIHQWLYSPLLGPGLFLEFVIFFYTKGMTPWTSDQPVARPLPTTQIQNKRTHRHPYLEWDSNRRYALDRAATVIGRAQLINRNLNKRSNMPIILGGYTIFVWWTLDLEVRSGETLRVSLRWPKVKEEKR